MLSEALDEPGADLQAIISVLTDDLTRGVPSFLGLIITMSTDGTPIILRSVDDDQLDSAAASLRLPLRAAHSVAVGHIVFYATDAGAFAQLASDARRL